MGQRSAYKGCDLEKLGPVYLQLVAVPVQPYPREGIYIYVPKLFDRGPLGNRNISHDL